MTCLRSYGELWRKPEIGARAPGVLCGCSFPGIHFGLQEKTLIYRHFYLNLTLWQLVLAFVRGRGTRLPQHTGPLILDINSSPGRGIHGS